MKSRLLHRAVEAPHQEIAWRAAQSMCALLVCLSAATAWADTPGTAPPMAVAAPQAVQPPIRVYSPTWLDSRMPWSEVDGWGGSGWQMGAQTSAHYATTGDESHPDGTMAQSGVEFGQRLLLVQAGMVSAGKHPYAALTVRQVGQWALTEFARDDTQLGLYAGRLTLGNVIGVGGYGSAELLGLRATSRDAWVMELGVPMGLWTSFRGGVALSVGVAVRLSRLFSWKDLMP